MALYPPLPLNIPSFPSGRYLNTNPLRREGGLRLITAPLPESLRRLFLSAWRRPSLFDGKITPLAILSTQRHHPGEAMLATKSANALGVIALAELEVTRRVLEAPIASVSRVTRNSLLIAQGAYLRCLYAALAVQLGEADALAEFHRLILKVG
jgi:hypothetical protein